MNKDKRLQEAVQIIKYGKILTEETNKDLEYAKKVIKDNHIKDLKKENELKDTQNLDQNLEEAFGLKGKLRRLNRAEKRLDKTNTKLKQYIGRRDNIEFMSPAFKDDKLNKKIDKITNKKQDQTTKIEKKASKLVDTILSNEKAWNKTKGNKMPTSVDTEIDTRNEKAFSQALKENIVLDGTRFSATILWSDSLSKSEKNFLDKYYLIGEDYSNGNYIIEDKETGVIYSLDLHNGPEINSSSINRIAGSRKELKNHINEESLLIKAKPILATKEDILEPEDITDEEQGDIVDNNPEIDEKNEVLDLLDEDKNGESKAEDLESEKYTNKGTLSDNELFGK